MQKVNHKVSVKIFAMPVEGCDPGKTWKAAFQFLSKRLYLRYGDQIDLAFIEIFSPDSFQHKDVMRMVEDGQLQPPYVYVNERMISNGGKLSEKVIREAVDAVIGNGKQGGL